MRLQRLIGRESDIALLASCWDRATAGSPQLLMLSGPRRVGKTFLLTHFSQGRRHIWHTANNNSEGVELERFADAVIAGLGAAALDAAGGQFGRWGGALRLVASHAVDAPLLVVIDEFPDLLVGSPNFAQQLRDVWDSIAIQSSHRLMLVLTGSAVASVERQVQGDAPLFGRVTIHHRLQPFSLQGALAFLPQVRAPEAVLSAYAACGGFPENLRAWQGEQDVLTNLRELAGSPGGVLLNAAPQILAALEGRGPGYQRVLRALSHDRLGHRQLLGRAGQDIQQVVSVLEDARVIRREVPVGTSFAETKRRLYRIIDPYLRFWFAVIGDEEHAIHGGRGEVVLRRAEPRWRRHLASVFEDEVREHAQRLADGGRWDGAEVGRWWGTPRDPHTRRAEQTEIDVYGIVGRRVTVAGEAKWAAPTREVLAELDRKLTRLPDAASARRALWSVRGRSPSRSVDFFTADDLLDS